jgi:hypothetical protein
MLRLNTARLAVSLLPFVLVACGDNSASDDPRTKPPLVRSAAIELANNTAHAFTGVVVARTQSDLGFRVQGKSLSDSSIPGKPSDRVSRYCASIRLT